MDRRSLGYSALLLVGLVIASVLLNRGLIQGLHADADVDITRDASTYLLGQTIVFTGTLTLPESEGTSTISQVRLVTSGPQPLDVILPVEPTADSPGDFLLDGFIDLSHLTTSTKDILKVKVEFASLDFDFGTFGTLPGTFPNTTLPTALRSGGVFKGLSGVGTITYEIHWTPPVFLDPAPVFTLITNASPNQTDVEFAIPTLAGAAAVTGTQLPQADLKFLIPTVGEPTGTKLPAVTSTVAIPNVQSLISTNAPANVPALRDITFDNGGFLIPQVTAATSSVNSFPNSSAGFNIQAVTVATAPGGVPNLPQVALHFTVTTSTPPRGIATDGTDFWVVSDGTGAGGKDQILRFTSSGSATGTPITAPSGSIEGIAYLDASLWVVDNDGHCGDAINPVCQNQNHVIFEVPVASPPASGSPSDWSSLSQIFAPDKFASINGITVEGSGSAGTLWLARSDGFEFFNILQGGTELNTIQTSGGVTGADSLALSGEFLYTSKLSTVTQWTKTGTKVQDFSIVDQAGGAPINNITGLTFKPVSGKQVLFAGSTADGKVYKGFFAESVTTDQVGMAFSPTTASVGEALWMVLDGTPKDKIVKVDPATGAFKTFGTNGAADAPNASIDGMTFLTGFLWLISNEPGQFGGKQRKLHKVSATNGAEQGTATDLNALGIFDDLGGITNDGTNLILHSKINFNQTFVVSTAGALVSQSNPCCPEPSFFGANGIAFSTDREQYFVANNDTIARYDKNRRFLREDTITQTAGTPPTGITGLTFDGRTLFIGHSGKVSKSFLADTVGTTPRGIAFTSATTTSFGRALYILVDGTPTDKILKVDPDTGALITSGQFGTAGVADAPTENTAGITFLSDFLWIAGSEGSGFEVTRKVYKINPSTGALVSSFTLNFFEPIGGIANDGTNLLLFFEPFTGILKVDTIGTDLGQSFPGPSGVFGANAFARHVARNVFLAAKNDKLLTIKSDLQSVASEKTLRVDSNTFTGQVQGMAFELDVLYVAYTEAGAGRVALGALKDTVTTDPKGLAFSPAGSTLLGTSIGEALWAVVDANPNDKILKLNPATGALITGTNFPSATNDVGFASAPSKDIEGATFLNGHLWLIANEQTQFGDQRKIYKVKATDGSVVDTFNVSQNVFDNAGGITNDGTNLIVLTTNTDQVFTFDQNGVFIAQQFADILNGARGAAIRSGANELLTALGSEVLQFGVDQNRFDFIAQFNVASLSGAQGLTFDTGTANDLTDDVLFIAHKDSVGRISRTGVPSGVTNDPNGLAYDAGANELYILVAGKGNAPAHVVVVDPNATSSPPSAIRDFDVPEGEANGITFLNGSLYVSLSRFGAPGPPQKDLVKLRPSDGLELARLSVNGFQGDSVSGLSNNGTDLLVVPQFGRPRIVVLDPNSGNELSSVELFDPSAFFDTQEMQALAYFASSTEYFPVKGIQAFQFDEDGELIEQFTVSSTSTFGNVKGAVFVGNVLYLAEGAGRSVHTTKVPAPTSVITNDPLGMDNDDDGNLYIAVDFGPEDKIMKLLAATSTRDTSFGDQGSIDSGSAEVQSLAIHDNALYAISNELETFEEGGVFLQFTIPLVRKFDKDTGAELGLFGISVQGNPGLPPFGCGFSASPGPNCRVISQTTIGALASDGQFLYAGARGEGIWLKLDVNNPVTLFGFPVLIGTTVIEDEGQLPIMAGFDAMQVITSPEFPANRQLIGANVDTMARFDRATGVMFRENPAAGVVSGQFKLTGTDIRGLAYTTSTRKLFIADDVSDSILSTTLPENTGVELTLVGNYSSQLLVSVDSTSVQDTTAAYAIQRNPQVLLDLQIPADGFVLTQASTTISGRINDPSIKTTTVGITLPFAKFVDDPVTPGVSESIWTADAGAANWHIACQDGTPNGFPGPTRFSSPQCSWRYGTPDAPGFGIDQTTQGSLTLKTANAVTASNDTQLKFTTGYDTEVPEDIDVKLVEVATVTTDLQGNDVVGAFRPVAQIVLSSQGGQIPKPANFHPSFQFIELDPLFVNPNLAPVTIGLSAFAGQRIVIRFNFDSVDDFANEGEGWYLDDIEVSGSGVKTIQIATTPLDPPVAGTVNGISTTLFRAFSSPFTLSEGLNLVGAQVTQPYSPFLSDLRTVSGFVDTKKPVVSLFGIAPAVSGLGQTLQGSVVEPTLVSLKIIQTIPGGATSTIFTLSSEPQGGTFSMGVTLKEGKNTFTVLVVDGGGLTNDPTSLDVIADTSAPTISDDGAIFPVGAVSARAGDEIVFQVTANDGAGDTSGVQKVELVVNGQVLDTLDRTDQLPDIVVDKFGISGNFVLFTSVPQGIPPGQFSITVRATDNAGNTSETTVSGVVTASLRSQNIFLFEGANLVGITLQDTRTSDRAFPNADVLAQELDTTRLESSFATNLSANLGNTSATGTTAIAGGSTVTVLDISNFSANDRIAVGTGDTTLTANALGGTSTISVAVASGFSAGQTIVISGDQGPFGLGFNNGSATSTIASIGGSTINLVSPLSTTHFLGARVTGIQTARIASTSGNQITIDGTFVVEPAAGAPVVERAKLGDIVEAIWFFTGGDTTGQWQSFTPASGGGLLAKLNQGRGYWFITKTEAFDRSAPLPGFLEGPVIPVTMQLDGVLFDPSGATPSLPATVQLAEAGWHLIALIGEQSRPVERGVRGVLFPTRQFNSLIEFRKFIDFDPTTQAVEIVGGVFNPLFAGDIANPGDAMEIARGFYIFMNQTGTHTP